VNWTWSASQSDICRQAHRHFQSWRVKQRPDRCPTFQLLPHTEEGLYHLRISDSGVKVHRCRRNIADSKNPDQGRDYPIYRPRTHIRYGSIA
jgi:hypothetical protein